MGQGTPLIPISICADDFGIEPGVDEAIIELSQKGRLSATSCLTTANGFTDRAQGLKTLQVDLGVHLNFTEFLGSPGIYLPLPSLILKSYLQQLDSEEVEAQIGRQLDAFENQLGRAPDFIDGHLHVHQFPVIRGALIKQLTLRYSHRRPWVRNTWPGALSTALPFMQRFKAGVIGVLGARAFTRMAEQSGMRFNRDFMGAYDFTKPHPMYATMLDAWFSKAQHGTLIMAHPAKYVSQGDAFGQDRVEEFRVLSSELFTLLLDQHQLVIKRMSEMD